MSSIVLTAEQNEAIEETLVGFHRGAKYRCIKGSAGTGKTTMMEKLVDIAPYEQKFIVAPTNKAAKVLEEKTGRSTQTVHKLFSLVLRDVEDTQELQQMGEVDFENNTTLIVIDESSMLNKELMELIWDAVENNPKVNVLFVGDPCQLNPIGEKESRAFSYDTYELTTVMRQAADNPVISLAQDIRDAQLSNPKRMIDYEDFEDGEHIQIIRSYDEWASLYVEEFNKGVDTHLIAWRNDRVKQLNTKIRRMLHGAEAKIPFLEDEQIMLYAPIMETNGKRRYTVLENSAFATVVEIDEDSQYFWNDPVTNEPVKFDTYHVTIEDECGRIHNIMTPKKPAQVQRYLSMIAARAKQESGRARGLMFRDWFYPLKNAYTEIRSAHAMTSHKSQGSTFESVFVDIRDLNYNREAMERLRSIYVAITRTSNKLYLYGV